MKLVCPWAQLLVLLRDPVERAYSQYQMSISKDGTDEQKRVRGLSSYGERSFRDIVSGEMAELAAAGVTPDCSPETYKAFLSKLPMGHGGHSLLLRGCYSLQLAPWMEAFPAEQLLVLGLSAFKGGREGINETMAKVYAFVGLPPHEIEDIEAKNTRAYEPMETALREELQTFYAPYNERLRAMLGEHITDCW